MPGPASRAMQRVSTNWTVAARGALVAVLLLTGLCCDAGPAISVGTSSVAPGTAGSVGLTLLGNTAGVALQFDLVFDPARIAAVSATTDSAAQNEILASGQPSNGVFRVVLYSLRNAQLAAGTILDLQLAVAPNSPEGPLILGLTNAVMADITGAGVQPIALQPGSLTISAGAGSRLTLLARFVNGQVQLQLTGPANKNYILQSSPDLTQWVNVSTNLLTDGQILITNSPPANSSQRFYRANYAP